MAPEGASPTGALLDTELGRALLEAGQRAGELERQRGQDLDGWHDPVDWCRREGARPWTGQEQILRAVAEHDRVAVPGGHGLGKGHVTAWLSRWWMVRSLSRCLITANTNSQVRANTWHEIRVCHARYGWPGTCGIQPLWSFPTDPTREVLGMTTDDPDAFQGKHAPNFLLIVDEAAGERFDKLWPVLRTLVTEKGGKVVLLGNRTRRVGAFAKACRGEWGFEVVQISSTEAADYQLEHGAIPGLTDWHTIEQWARDCGFGGEGLAELRAWIESEGVRDDWFRPRVLGLPPLGEGGGLFPPELLEEAKGRRVEPAGPLVIGIDVARKGGDQTVVAVRRGQRVRFARVFNGLDHAQQLTAIDEWLRDLQRVHDEEEGPAISLVRVDATGEGSALPDLLRARGWPVERAHFGGKPKRPDKFKNRRAEGYRALKDWLANGGSIPDEDRLVEELEHIEPIPGGVAGVGGATVEALPKKDKLRALIGRSPDRADAVVLTVMPAVEAEPRVDVW